MALSFCLFNSMCSHKWKTPMREPPTILTPTFQSNFMLPSAHTSGGAKSCLCCLSDLEALDCMVADAYPFHQCCLYLHILSAIIYINHILVYQVDVSCMVHVPPCFVNLCVGIASPRKHHHTLFKQCTVFDKVFDVAGPCRGPFNLCVEVISKSILATKLQRMRH